MRQFEILAGGHLKLNQADIIMAGDNTRTSTGGQHAFNARGTLIRRVAQRKAAGRLPPETGCKSTGMKNGAARRASSPVLSRRSNGSRQASFTLYAGRRHIPRRRRTRWLREKHPPAHRFARRGIKSEPLRPKQHRSPGVVTADVNPVTTRRLPDAATAAAASVNGKKVLHQPAAAQRVQRVKTAWKNTWPPGSPLLIKHRRHQAPTTPPP